MSPLVACGLFHFPHAGTKPWYDGDSLKYRGLVNLRKYLVLLAIVVFGSTGDVLLSRGMREVGEIHLSECHHAFTAVANPWVFAGVVCLCVFFASYLSALSWADLTYVLPATATGYVVLALLSKAFLHEQISPQRWAGIIFITAGVGFVAGGPSQTERATDSTAAALHVGASAEPES